LPVNLQRAESDLDQRLAGLFRVSDLGVLVRNGQESASLVADVSGHIATLQMRIANEPPLNPSAIKLLAAALFELTGLGVQVILATHSLFLLREFEILLMHTKTPYQPIPKYFSLGVQHGQVLVSQGYDIADIEPLVLLDENLMQSDRYLEADKV